MAVEQITTGVARLLFSLLRTDGSLAQKTVRGGFLVFLSFGLRKALGIVRSIVLARLLVPSDFGLMGLVSVCTMALVTFTETGINMAIIQRKDCDVSTLNTGWMLSIFRGLFLFTSLFLISPYAASFFEALPLQSLLRVMSVTFLVESFNNVGVILLLKELDFKRQMYFEVTTDFMTVLITIILAFFLKSVWALVFGLLAKSVISLIASFLIHPFRPRVEFDLQRARDLMSYGKYVLGSAIIIYFTTQGDDALVGKILGTSALGFYTMAYTVSNMPATTITGVISKVTFPAYSKLQDDLESLQKAFLRTLKFISILSFPLAGGLFVLAPEIVVVVFGDKWMPMVPAMRVLCLFGAIRSMADTTGPVYQAVGKPQIVFYITTFKLSLIAIFIYPLTRLLGIFGTSLAVTIPMMIEQGILWRILSNTIGVEISKTIVTILPSLCSTFLMVVLLYFLTNVVNYRFSVFYLISWVALGALIYLVCLYLFDRSIVAEVKRLVSFSI